MISMEMIGLYEHNATHPDNIIVQHMSACTVVESPTFMGTILSAVEGNASLLLYGVLKVLSRINDFLNPVFVSMSSIK